jgi:signal transduction histidine kinase
LITEREDERKELARELHDQVIQDLLGLNYRLEEVEGEEKSRTARQGVADIRSGIRNVIGELRQVCSDLRPPTIDHHGLSAAIASLAHEWAERNELQLQLEIDPVLGRLPEMIELSVFRIVQEGLVVRKLRLPGTCTVHAADSSAGLLVPDTTEKPADPGRPGILF